MEAIKLKLTQFQVGGLMRYLQSLKESYDPQILLLLEFRNYLWKRALAHQLNQRYQAAYTFPASVAVSLWLRWQNQQIELANQITLSQLDAVLKNRGIQ